MWVRLLDLIRSRTGHQTKQGKKKFQHVASPVSNEIIRTKSDDMKSRAGMSTRIATPDPQQSNSATLLKRLLR
jgi:hypothetical protein